MGGDDDRFFGVSIFEDLEQGEAEVLVEWLEAEVVKDEQGYFFDLVEDFDIRAVEFGGCDFFDEAVHVEIECFVSHLAGMSAQGAGEERFSASGGSGDEQVLGLTDEVAGGQQGELFGVQVTVGRTMYLGQHGIEAEFGQGEVELAFSVLAVECFGLGECGKQVVCVGLLLGWEF